MGTSELDDGGIPMMENRAIHRGVEILLVTACTEIGDKYWPV